MVVVDNTDGATAIAEEKPLLPNDEVTCAPKVSMVLVIFVVAGPVATMQERERKEEENCRESGF